MGTFKRSAPIFPVRDVRISLEYYGRLGFATREYQHGGYCFVTCDGSTKRSSSIPRTQERAVTVNVRAATWSRCFRGRESIGARSRALLRRYRTVIAGYHNSMGTTSNVLGPIAVRSDNSYAV